MSGKSGTRGAAAKDSNDLDVFCFMVFEEFLMRKGLESTLAEFREEWGRPPEETTLVSWYETALKLRLPELVSSGPADATVMENLVWALLRESSIKTRRAPEVTVAGLATLPRQKSLPALETSSARIEMTPNDDTKSFETTTETLEASKRKQTGIIMSASARTREMRIKKAEEAAAAAKEANLARKAASSKKGFGAVVPLGQSAVQLSEEAAAIIKRQIEEMQTERAMQARVKNISKASSENWVPEIARMRSLERDFLVAKENLADIQLREASEAREMKQFRVTELERALKAESLGKMGRLSCGCCMLIFLPINLPLKVSQKAILDIRVKWSGGLNSSTVFTVPGQPAAITQAGTDGDAAETTAVSATLVSKSQKSFIDKMAERLSVVPRCYDQVPVCTFCAQLFQDSDCYRPSYDQIYFEERKVAHLETAARNKLRWDPLYGLEKDRELEEQGVSVSLQGGSETDEARENQLPDTVA